MARTNAPRLNFLGVISILIGIAAFVATKVPLAGYGPIPIALLGIGVGILAFIMSLMIRWGSGVPVLGVVVSLGALALAGYDNGTLPDWWAKIHPAPQKPVPAVIAPAQPVVPAQPAEPPRLHNIFDDTNSNGSGSRPPVAPTPAPAVNPTPAPTIPTPPPVPAIVQPPMPTLAEAHAKLDAATASVERSLANDPAYVQAKADVAAADGKRKAALAESGPGSPQVQEASSKWLDAKSKLKKLVDAAALKDPTAQAAQREMNDAEANARGGKGGSGK
jgi:hypothetical protein